MIPLIIGILVGVGGCFLYTTKDNREWVHQLKRLLSDVFGRLGKDFNGLSHKFSDSPDKFKAGKTSTLTAVVLLVALLGLLGLSLFNITSGVASAISALVATCSLAFTLWKNEQDKKPRYDAEVEVIRGLNDKDSSFFIRNTGNRLLIVNGLVGFEYDDTSKSSKIVSEYSAKFVYTIDYRNKFPLLIEVGGVYKVDIWWNNKTWYVKEKDTTYVAVNTYDDSQTFGIETIEGHVFSENHSS